MKILAKTIRAAGQSRQGNNSKRGQAAKVAKLISERAIPVPGNIPDRQLGRTKTIASVRPVKRKLREFAHMRRNLLLR